MGNLYRIMVDITLTCRLHREIRKNAEKFDIRVNTSDSILSLEDKIYDAVKNKDDKMFSGIVAKDLDLWKVKIKNDNEEYFSKLDLRSNDTESIRGISISEFWVEQPPTDCTHIIVDSRYSSLLRDFPSQTRLNQEPTKETTQKTNEKHYISRGSRQIRDAVAEKIIIKGDELWISKKYQGVQVSIGCKGCKVINVDKVSPIVSLIDNEDEETKLSEWTLLEKWLLFHYKKRTNVNLDLNQIKHNHSSENIRLVRDGNFLGFIHDLIKNHNENI
uniref:5'-nucleotidase surE n=1 Tax=Anthurium amnicola TaxID=1678845 RepID=A0A1D1ZLN9_9ARAE